MRFFLLATICLLATSPVVADEIYCFAAASLTEALTELGNRFATESGSKVLFHFGASSMLARQIQEGAPADLFFAADEEKMDWLQQKGLLLNATRRSLLSNTLVVVSIPGSNRSIDSLHDLVGTPGRIALAEFHSVPAGIYARQHLIKIGIWEKLKERVVPVQNVRAALAAVESENVSYAIVFKTDARIAKRIQVVYEIVREEGPRISYPIAVLKQSKNIALAKRFYDFLLSPAGVEIFRKHAFLIH